jgi:hypothetical protein
MTDVRADRDGDRLPWLEAVDEDDREEGPGAAKLIAFVVLGLLAIGLIVGGLFWMTNRGDGGAEAVPEGGELIAAPADDYKVKPVEPGGMEVKGKGDTALAASEGAEPKGQLNVNAAPEAPVAAPRPQQQAAAQPAPAPKAAPAQVAIAQPKAPPAPAPQPKAPAPAAAGGSGQTIQLGAFDSQAQANAAWKALSGRFKYLAPLNQSIQTAEVNGRTFYRLRASGADARSVCNRLKIAGETCLPVN